MKPNSLTRSAGTRVLVAASIAAAILVAATHAKAEEIRVLSAAAIQTVLKGIAPDFERTTGHRLAIAYDTIDAINRRVLDGEAADLIIGSTQPIAGLVKAGRIEAGSQVTIARVGIGIVMASGTDKRCVISVADLKHVLLAIDLQE